MVVDPVAAALVVVIGTTATHYKRAHLLYLGKRHGPAPTACINEKPIIHSIEREVIQNRWKNNAAVLLSLL
jgi:hypothetical protein